MGYCTKCGAPLPEDALFCTKCGNTVSTHVPPTSQVQNTASQGHALKLATWGERFIAWLIDAVILSIFIGILNIFTWFAWTPVSFLPSCAPFFNFSAGGVIYFLYWMIMEGAYGQSLGKMIMHLKVTHLDGASINMATAALESIGKAFFMILDLLIGLLFYPGRKQRIFNYLSQTVVIRER